MRSLYSSDQWAPGFSFAFLFGWGVDGLLGSAGLRAPTLSLSVGRSDDRFGLFISVWVNWIYGAGVSSIFAAKERHFGSEF
jgi:hypothetical protein